MANSHYIPRSLTKYWEYGERNFIYFDFKLNKFSDEINKRPISSESFFSQENLFSDDVEKFLCKYIEKPFSDFRDKLLKTGSTKIKSWKTYRSLWLMFMTLPGRSFEAEGIKNEKFGIESLSKKDETFIDQLVQVRQLTHGISVINLENYSSRLFFPEQCLFYLIVPWESSLNYSISFCLPIHPNILLMHNNKNISVKYIENICYNSHEIMLRSLGLSSYSNRVIIPNEIYKENNREKLREMLTTNRKLLDSLNIQENEVKNIYKRLGIFME